MNFANTPDGEAGEISARGPQVMQGYWNNDDANREAFTDDGFFRTGDIGMFTDGGFVKIVDRKKDMVLVSGFNVYPNEIEATVSACEGVVECACVGVPDDKTGEALRVFAVKSDDADVDAEKIIAHCRIVSNSMTEIAAQFRGARGNLAELFEPRLLRLVQLQCEGRLCVLSRLVQWQFHIPR